MYPAAPALSVSSRPLVFIKWLSLFGLVLVFVGDPSVRHGIALLMRIAWLYMVTGARG
jgi:hypothetical protein